MLRRRLTRGWSGAALIGLGIGCGESPIPAALAVVDTFDDPRPDTNADATSGHDAGPDASPGAESGSAVAIGSGAGVLTGSSASGEPYTVSASVGTPFVAPRALEGGGVTLTVTSPFTIQMDTPAELNP